MLPLVTCYLVLEVTSMGVVGKDSICVIVHGDDDKLLATDHEMSPSLQSTV